jgi:hypothetical protein
MQKSLFLNRNAAIQVLLHFKRENLFQRHSDLFNGRSQSRVVTLRLSNASGQQFNKRPIAKVKEHHALTKVNLNQSFLEKQSFGTSMQYAYSKLSPLRPTPYVNTEKYQRRNSS